MTVPALWAKHRKIALAVSAEWRIPGLDADDVRQEALVALWEAARKYDPERGTFPPFARLYVKGRLRDLLQAATRQKRTAELVRDVDVPVRDRIEARLELLALIDATKGLSSMERTALSDSLNGAPVGVSKSHEKALYRARAKLKKTAKETECPRS